MKRGHMLAIWTLWGRCERKALVRLFCFAVMVGLAGRAAPAAERTLKEWRFDQPGQLEGWQPNGHLLDVNVTNGVLRCRAAGADPILVLTPLLDLPASPWQVLEVRMKADREGEAELFWSNTAQGRYGGFSQDKTTRFAVIGDNQWHVYRVFPFWHTEKRIVRLRFDLYDAAAFQLDALRLVELDMPGPAALPECDFTTGLCGWQAVGEAKLTGNQTGATLTTVGPNDFLLAPPVNIAAETLNYLSLQLTAEPGTRAELLFATDREPGWHRYSFPLMSEGRPRAHNVDLLRAPAWRGRVLALGLRLSPSTGAPARLSWLKVTDSPQGPPQIEVTAFALEEALARAGRPVPISARVANTGGDTASNLQARLDLPPGVQLLNPIAAVSPATTISSGEETVFTWRLRAARPTKGEAQIEVRAQNAAVARARAEINFSAAPVEPKRDYVPVPKPVRGNLEVGTYYFPGWKTASQWLPLQRFPERKPVLGWYREGDPEVADWHIKWAVEHGLTFFVYDWYWSQGARQLEHGLHDGYFKARYRHLLKFCLLWANHNPPRTSSLEDCQAVTQYWITNYFRRPEYFTLEGKPVVIIFSPDRLTTDLGSTGVKRALAAMRDECRRAGVPEVYLLACVSSAGQARQMADEGYDAVTAYNWPGLGRQGEELQASFERLIAGYRRHWEHLVSERRLPLLLPVSGGWDSRPWHGDAALVRFGRTPDLFRQHLIEARNLVQTSPAAAVVPKAILIEAWNEWGEGSYIEPHQEYGFGYLEAVREVFTAAPREHVDLAPADVGRGPFEVLPLASLATAWNFTTNTAGWDHTMHLTGLSASNGVLTTRSTGNDPALFGPPLRARAGDYRAVSLRLRLTASDARPFTDIGQLFWSTARLPESEAASVRFPVHGDGQWHTYRLPVAENRRWRDFITRLRLDPCSRAEIKIELGEIRLERE